MTEVVAPERRHVVNLTRHVRVGPAKVELLTHGRLPSPFTARDMYRNEWTGPHGALFTGKSSRSVARGGEESAGRRLFVARGLLRTAAPSSSGSPPLRLRPVLPPAGECGPSGQRRPLLWRERSDTLPPAGPAAELAAAPALLPEELPREPRPSPLRAHICPTP